MPVGSAGVFTGARLWRLLPVHQKQPWPNFPPRLPALTHPCPPPLDTHMHTPQVVLLYAIQHGFTDSVPTASLVDFLDSTLVAVRAAAPEALAEIAATKQLTATAEKGVRHALKQQAKEQRTVA